MEACYAAGVTNLPLFPSTPAEAIEARLLEVFERFIKHPPPGRVPGRGGTIRTESAATYRDMWRAFAHHCASCGLELSTITGTDLRRFLVSRGGPDELSDRYIWRLLRLIDRVTAFEADELKVPSNQAAADLLEDPKWKYANASKRTALPSCLAADQCRHLVVLLTGRVGEDSGQPIAWQTLRDRTAVAVQLAAGLTPGEARALTDDQIALRIVERKEGEEAIPWKIRMPGNGNLQERDTPIALWAQQLLASWRKARVALAIDGPWVFPGRERASKPWSKRGFEIACERVLKEAGIPLSQGGTFCLRHTFAVRQLRAGKDAAQVAYWLGVEDLSLIARYRRVLASPVSAV